MKYAGPLADGGRLYGLAAVLTSPADHVEINAQFGGLLLPGRAFLHYYDETAERRVKIANSIATLPIHGAILGLVETTDQARRTCTRKAHGVVAVSITARGERPPRDD